MTDVPPPSDKPRPRSLGDLFLAFTWLALQGFGGVLAIVQRELVEKKQWLTHEEFVEEWAVAQVMPGPNVINLAVMLGGRYFGLPGALTALAGLLLAPLLLVLLIAVFYARYASHPGVSGALRGMGAVAAGLIIATGIKMLPSLRKHPLGPSLCLLLGGLCFVAVAWLRWPLAYVLLGLGAAGCILTYRRLDT